MGNGKVEGLKEATLAQLHERAKEVLPPSQLSWWNKPQKKISFKQLENVARATGIPLAYILLNRVPEPLELTGIPFFRRKADRPISVVLDKTVMLIQSRVNLASQIREEFGHEQLSYIRSISLEEDIEEAATLIKQILGIHWPYVDGTGPKTKREAFLFLRMAVEKIGILVFAGSYFENNIRLKLDPEEFKGFTIIDKYAPAVFINTNTYISAQIFTLCHELVHIFLGESGISDIDTQTFESSHHHIEQFCNKVAAAFLIPRENLSESLHNFNQVLDVSEHLKVSPMVVIIRALDLGLIDKQKYVALTNFYKNEFQNLLKNEMPRTAKRFGNWYRQKLNQLGVAFVSLAIQGLEAKIVPPNYFARVTGLKLSHIPKIMDLNVYF